MGKKKNGASSDIERDGGFKKSKTLLAVVDIGGNSISLEVRPLKKPTKEKPEIHTKYKAFSALASGISVNGKISKESKKNALNVLHNIKDQLEDLKEQGYHVVTKIIGTAPFRDAENGERFRQKILKETGLNVRVLNGHEEATYAARGVLVRHPNLQTGLVIDTGGGSTEFAIIKDGQIEETFSIPVGMQRIASFSTTEEKAAFIREQLATVPQIFKEQETVISTGGINRTVAKAYAKANGLKIKRKAGDHIIEAKKFDLYVNELAGTPVETLTDMFQEKGERARQIQDLKLLNDILHEELGTKNVVLSKATVRDGMRAEMIELIEAKLKFDELHIWAPETDTPAPTATASKKKKYELELANA